MNCHGSAKESNDRDTLHRICKREQQLARNTTAGFRLSRWSVKNDFVNSGVCVCAQFYRMIQISAAGFRRNDSAGIKLEHLAVGFYRHADRLLGHGFLQRFGGVFFDINKPLQLVRL